ncbi:MAG: hypothetical protein GF335_04415 [Candidatus Moranbacteria bacterium]|nr:hypothetical protein [Candidatus Moranbacteria bacterium]
MPGLDGTGPMGNRMTGRGLGSCGRGRKGAFGTNKFYGRRFITDAEEKDLLKEEKDYLQSELKAVEEKLSQLES